MRSLVRMEMGKTDEDSYDEPFDYDRGLNYPAHYVIDTWRHFRDHGIYPNGGGYDDQDPALMDDWRYLNELYALAVRDKDTGDVTQLLSKRGHNARDWREMD